MRGGGGNRLTARPAAPVSGRGVQRFGTISSETEGRGGEGGEENEGRGRTGGERGEGKERQLHLIGLTACLVTAVSSVFLMESLVSRRPFPPRAFCPSRGRQPGRNQSYERETKPKEKQGGRTKSLLAGS